MNKIRTIFNTIRVYLLTLFSPRYVRMMRVLRQGKCNNCGKCCGVGEETCKFLKNNKCSIYNRWKKDGYCFNPFPIDQFDKNTIAPECSYYWIDTSYHKNSKIIKKVKK